MASYRRHPPIHRMRVPGHKGCSVRTKPQHHGSDFFSLANPANRVQLRHRRPTFGSASTARSNMAVRITPGQTAVTRMFLRPYSSAADLVSPSTACLLPPGFDS